jgi:hypothetical protein
LLSRLDDIRFFSCSVVEPDHEKIFFYVFNFNRDAPDIQPDNPAFVDFRYPTGYRIALPDIRPDIR